VCVGKLGQTTRDTLSVCKRSVRDLRVKTPPESVAARLSDGAARLSNGALCLR
jgi:hypothetical protein